MGSRPARRPYCRCGTYLAADNPAGQCARCQRISRDKLIVPPQVPAEFWQSQQLQAAFAAQHIGRVTRAYRLHPYHQPVYGPGGISQGVLGQWLGLSQPQVSRIENGPPIRNLDTLAYWARTLHIPPDLLWFDMPDAKRRTADHGDPTEEAIHRAIQESNVSPTLTRQVWVPGVVNGRTVLLPLALPIFANSDLNALVGESLTDAFTSELSSALDVDLDFDELQHVAAALEDARSYLDGPVVDYFRRQLDACTADDGTLGPTKVLPAVLGILGAIEQHANDVKPAVRRDLLSVGALGAEFAGWLYRDIRHPGRARFWYSRATEWAQEAGDTAAQGYVLLKKSQMAYDERDALRVLTLAQAAQYGPWQLSKQTRAEVTQQEARGLAMLGEPLGTIEQKLDDARQLLADATADDEEPNQLGSCYNEDTLALRNASCYIEAGKPQQAAGLYRQVLSSDRLSRRDRGYYLARLASSLALAGEPDEAAGAGLEAIQLATATTSARTTRELRRTLHTLKPWCNRPGPRQLREAMPVS